MEDGRLNFCRDMNRRSHWTEYWLGPNQAFTPRLLLGDVAAGLIIGAMGVFIEISFAAMIFSGPLVNHLHNGIGFLLLGSAVISVVVALTSSFRGSIALPQDVSAVIIALMAGQIASGMQQPLTLKQLFSGENVTAPVTQEGFLTVMAAIALTSLVVGLLFVIVAMFNLGSLIRFIPYPVIGGFLGGTGLLLVIGAFGVLTPTPILSTQLETLLQPDELARWLPGLGVCLALLFASRRYQHFLFILMPALLIGSLGLFYFWMALSGTSATQTATLLLGPFPEGSLWQPLVPSDLSQVDWSKLLNLGPIHMASTVLFSLIAMLLNASGIELSAKQDILLNTELRSAGWANMLGGLVGSPSGYQTLSLSVLSQKIGSGTRLTGICVGLVCASAVIVGSSLLGFFPRFILGGMVMFLGFSFLVEWLYDAWFKMSKLDYAMVVLIAIVVAAYGVTLGIVTGIVVAILLFVVRYSLNNPIYQSLSAAEFHSTAERADAQMQLLRERGEQVHILMLQGFLFFGTAHTLYNAICARLNDAQQPALKHLILDFERVTNMDTSTEVSFHKVMQQASVKGFDILLVKANARLQRRLDKIIPSQGDDRVLIHNHVSLDHAVYWCEEKILNTETASAGGVHTQFESELSAIFSSPELVQRFMAYLVCEEVTAGDMVVRQGDPAEHIFLVASGQLEVLLEVAGGHAVRLRTIQAGALFGELAVYLNERRSASIKALQPSTVYKIDKAALERMWSQDGQLAAQFHARLIQTLARRLVDNNRLVERFTH